MVTVKNFLATTDMRMMSLQDNQAASSPPWLHSQVLMYQRGERRFSLADQKQPEFFRHLIKWASKEPTFLELQTRLHMLGEYPKRKKETICLIAMLLCKQNSHEISSSPIIWVSSLSLCVNVGKKNKKEKKEKKEGWREREESAWLADHPQLSPNLSPSTARCLAPVPTHCGRCGAL